ncbi:MAG: DJ-1/PfpI family protein [Anaerolineales bacterium]|nr:DJ-1/PfpI family protein [Anaerolineales bacterium]
MNFGFLLFPDAEELDFIGPWEIIGMWGMHFNGPEKRLLISQDGAAVQCAKGLSVNPHCSFMDCPPLDFLLIPGGQGTRKEVNNQVLVDFVKQQATACKQILSVCTGAFILQAAGLLAHKRATTHWGSLDRLRKYPDVTVVEERFVRDGNIWTAAGVSAGIDLALALIASLASEEVAGKVQLAAEYYPSSRRYGYAPLSPGAPAYLNK